MYCTTCRWFIITVNSFQRVHCKYALWSLIVSRISPLILPIELCSSFWATSIFGMEFIWFDNFILTPFRIGFARYILILLHFFHIAGKEHVRIIVSGTPRIAFQLIEWGMSSLSQRTSAWHLSTELSVLRTNIQAFRCMAGEFEGHLCLLHLYKGITAEDANILIVGLFL